MANPTLKSSAPGYSSIVAALWVSDVVDQSGTPTKGAWDAKNSVFYPAWGASSLSGVALGSTTRRGLASAAANCGIDLGLSANHTGTVFDLAGPEITVVALFRRLSTASGYLVQNEESYSSGGNCGWSVQPGSTASVTGRVRAGVTPPGSALTAASSSVAPANELVCLVFDRSSSVTPRLWKHGAVVTGGSAAPNTDPITYGTPGAYLRRAALFNYPEARAFNAAPLELYGLIVYSDGDWVDSTALAPLGSTEANLLAGAFHSTYFLFGDEPDTDPPVLTSPTGTATGATTATGTVSTNDATGTLYRLASTNATELAATVKAAALTQSVSATGVQNVNFTGLSPSTTYYPHYVHRDASGNDSARVTGASFTTSSAPATATTLSGPSGGQVSVASGSFTVGANGTITGTVTVTPSDGGGSGTFSPTSVNISAGTPTATFTYTPGSAGAKTISISDNGSLTDASPLTYTATLVAGRLLFTANPADICREFGSGSPIVSTPVTLWVHDATTGTKVAQIETTTNNVGLFGTITSGAMALSTLYRIDWKFSTGEYGSVYRTSEAT